MSADGLCECGCGEAAPIAKRSHAASGYVKGQPKRYVKGHRNRKYPRGATCSVDGCTRVIEAHDLCHSHFEYQRRHPGTAMTAILDTDESRFFAKVKKLPSGHWMWSGATASGGRYGMSTLGGRLRPAHVVAWVLLGGTDVPDGLEVDHLCRVTLCVNPEHLQLATHRMNVLRGDSPTALNAAKTHCHRGHEFTAESTRITSTGGRQCLRCVRSEEGRANQRERNRRHRDQKRAGLV